MKVVITGGAGFIGANVALRHLDAGDDVIVIDNLSRRGSEINRDVLFKAQKTAKGSLKFIKADIRDFNELKKIFRLNCFYRKKPILVYHLAAQVAVTTSVKNPREDFQINALGTFNILEAIRQLGLARSVILFYSSTNKVYGGMEKEKFRLTKNGWSLADYPDGIDENYPLDFHSPYGCSKGAAEQYVRDYSRIYGLKTVVFRQSCIYGINQYGVEDQGWLAHFLIKIFLYKKPITIYGDGNQVRDALYIDDLLHLYERAYKNINKISGEIFNIGGGASNAVSLLGFVKLVEKKFGGEIKIKFAPWRPGDQKFFVSDNSKATRILGWEPKVSVGEEGLNKTLDWIISNADKIKKVMG